MSDILLATKIHIPPLHGNLVNRTHLVQRLNDGVAQSRPTLVSAPADYGKSTLLGAWVSKINIPVAWLSLERGENVPARFWSYFITALNAIPQVRLAGIGESISQVLHFSQPEPKEGSLALQDGKTVVANRLECEYAGQCEAVCPVQAITRLFYIVPQAR